VIPAAAFRMVGTGSLSVEKPMKFPFAQAAQVYQPHGPVWYAGASASKTRRWYWMERNSVLAITYTPSLTADTYFNLSRWSPEGEDNTVYQIGVIHDVAATPSTNNLTVAESGYYAVALTSTGQGNFDFTSVTLSGVTSVWCHRSAPGVSKNIASTAGMRINATALMYSNDASPLYREGKISMLQAPQGDFWLNYVGKISNPPASGFQSVSSSQTSITLVGSKGMYGFLKPTQFADFDFKSYYNIWQGNLVDCYYPLLNESSFLVLYAQITTALGQDGRISCYFSMEFLTTDTWRVTRSPESTPKEFDDALALLESIPQFHENPSHLQEIWGSIVNGIKTVAGYATTYGPALIKGAETVASIF